MMDKYLLTQPSDPCLGMNSQIILTFYGNSIYLFVIKVDISQSHNRRSVNHLWC